VTKGQLIGLNTICAMLHFELWDENIHDNTKLRPLPNTQGGDNCINGDDAPVGVHGLNNPRALLRHLEGKWCDPPVDLPEPAEEGGFSLTSRFAHDALQCEPGAAYQCVPCNFNS